MTSDGGSHLFGQHGVDIEDKATEGSQLNKGESEFDPGAKIVSQSINSVECC